MNCSNFDTCDGLTCSTENVMAVVSDRSLVYSVAPVVKLSIVYSPFH